MSENLTEAFDAPIIEVIGGGPVEFSRPTIGDFTTWANQIHAQRKVSGRKLVFEHIKDPVERVRALAEIEGNVPGLGDVARETFSIAGARKMLELSLKNSGKDEGATAEIIKKIPPYRLQPLAQQVSGLFPPKKDEAERSGGGDGDPKAPDNGTGTSPEAS